MYSPRYVQISYPEAFPQVGVDRALFSLALRKMFKGGSLCICTLDTLRSRVFGDEGADPAFKKLKEDLRILHCVDFDNLDPEIMEAVPALVGEFLGLHLQWEAPLPQVDRAMGSPEVLRVKPGIPVPAAAGLAALVLFTGLTVGYGLGHRLNAPGASHVLHYDQEGNIVSETGKVLWPPVEKPIPAESAHSEKASSPESPSR